MPKWLLWRPLQHSTGIQKILPWEECESAASAYLGGMARTDDFRMAPGDGLKYYAPERKRDQQDREGGYIVLALVVALVLLAMATGQVTVFHY